MKKIIGVISLCITWFFGYSQDPQFSQFYTSPMVINPAFTGTTECFRAGTQVRTQWVGLDRPFNTGLIYADVNAFPINSGFGIMALYDQIGHAKIATTELSGLYSYHIHHNGFNLQLGLQGTYVNRSIDYSKLIFEDQFSDIVLTQANTIDPITNWVKTEYVDFSTGALFYSDDHYWLGFSAHHLNQPSQGFFRDQADSKLNIKYSFHGGFVYQKQLNSGFFNIYPCFLYKSQTTFDQFDIGAIAYYNSVMFGLMYRGLLIKEYKGVLNNDAVQFHIGYKYNEWKMSYSYDLTSSRLGIMNTWGTHEISLIKNFCIDLWPHKPHTAMKNKLLACPDFKASTLKRRESWKTQWDPKHKRNQHVDGKEVHHHNKVRRKNLHHH